AAATSTSTRRIGRASSSAGAASATSTTRAAAEAASTTRATATSAVLQRERIDRSREWRTDPHVPCRAVHAGLLVHRQRANDGAARVEHGERDLGVTWHVRQQIRDARARVGILSGEPTRPHTGIAAVVRLEEQGILDGEEVCDRRLLRFGE